MSKGSTPKQMQQVNLRTIKSEEGVPRPVVYGISRPLGGNIIAAGDPLVYYVKKKSGKGGQTTTSVSSIVLRTYAIRVCEGPITRFRRIWRNNKLVYDNRGTAWGAVNNPVFLNTARLFLGDYDQAISADLEAVFGVGNVPAHRGTAYLVMVNDNLTDMQGAIPQYVFEVERHQGYYLTSTPYPMEAIESVSGEGMTVANAPDIESTEDIESLGMTIVDGSLRDLLIEYQDGIPEEVESLGMTVEDGSLRNILIEYQDGVPEEIESQGMTIEDGELRNVLIVYNFGEPEEVESLGMTITGGTLA